MLTDKQYNLVMKAALLILALLVVICLILRIVLITSDKDEPEAPVSDSATDEPAGSESESESSSQPIDSDSEPTDSSVILAPSADAGQEYIDKLIFIGDSTTHTLDAFGFVPETQIWTGETKTLSLYTNIDQVLIVYPQTGEKMTIGQAAELAKPEYIVITLGLNGGVGDYFEERQFKAAYTKLINAIKSGSPETKIILQNIFPVSSLIDTGRYTKINNPNINTANGWILDIAQEMKLKYLDSREVLIDAAGDMKLEYSQPDGIHMQPAAAQAILNYIRTHAYPN